MFGLGVVKGLGVTLKRFINTYVDDAKYMFRSATNEEAFAKRQGPEGTGGLFTVEYPEMKLIPPENFRFLPFLVTDYEVSRDEPGFDEAEWLELNRCTACGICAKVCPPQCIWIVRASDPETGKPVTKPDEFYIDTDICMSCGFCAEFCPFDSIKMDHIYELADYERDESHIYDLEKLTKPTSYYDSIRPTWNALEAEARRKAKEEKQRKAEEKKRLAAEKAAAAAVAAKAKAEAEAKAQQEEAQKIKETEKEKTVEGKDLTSISLETVEGIGQVYAGKLTDIGITNAEELLEKGGTPKGRKEIADQTEISSKLILRWVNMVDLFRIKGVSEENADLLEAAGVDTVPELAQRNAENLHQKMVETNEEKSLVRRVAGQGQVESWVAQAKELPRKINY